MRPQRKIIRHERKTNDEKTRALLILCATKKLKAHIISDVSFEYSDIMYMLILDATDPMHWVVIFYAWYRYSMVHWLSQKGHHQLHHHSSSQALLLPPYPFLWDVLTCCSNFSFASTSLIIIIMVLLLWVGGYAGWFEFHDAWTLHAFMSGRWLCHWSIILES